MAREHERHLAEGLTCVTGEVLDLSAGGIRIRSAVRPPVKAGGLAPFTINAGGKQITLQGRVAWIRRASLLSGPYEYGVQFVGVTAAMRALLERIALYGYVPERGEVGTTGKGSSGGGAARTGGGAANGAESGHSQRVTVTTELPDFYEAIGVSSDATAEEIHGAFRVLAKRLHPDVCKDPDANERFSFITRVYEVLGDSELRVKYDEAIARRAAA
jgi:hypothetical protein